MTARHMARCVCGKVELELSGPPLISPVCHCDDCQAGSAMLEALPGAPPILDAGRGTPYALYRKDRLRCTRGAELLQGYKLQPGSTTHRMVASCCNSAVLVQLPSVLHWTPVYRDRILPPAPPLEMRIQTRFIPAGIAVPADLRAVSGTPLTFVVRMVAARLAMLLGR